MTFQIRFVLALLGIVSFSISSGVAEPVSTRDEALETIAESVFPAGKSGAVVITEVNTGKVICLYSSHEGDQPSENSGDTIPHAVRAYNPGSLMFPVIALSGSMGGHDKAKIECGGGREYGNKFMKCWITAKIPEGHGELSIEEAIAQSCNAYFYELANRIGIEAIKSTASLVGPGEKTELLMKGESAGNIPDPEWLSQQEIEWTDDQTALVSIGQGATEATPVQMASVAATIASDGIYLAPHQYAGPHHGTERDLIEEGYDLKTVQRIQDGMYRCVENSTGLGARSLTIDIAGKTGTAQTGNPKRPTNAWFMGYAPYAEPKYAVCVLVLDGRSGGATAAPVGRDILVHLLPPKP